MPTLHYDPLFNKGNFMRSILSAILITFVFVVSPATAQKRNITEKDLFNFVWIADPQVSPDGSRVAFVRVTVNEKKDGYNTAIWSVSTAGGESHQLTSGTRDSSPRWSPDGKYLVFVRVTEKDGRPDVPQLFMLAMAGGDSFQFTTLTRGAGQPQWSPDGKWIAFVNNANPEDLAKQKDMNKEGLPSPAPTTAQPAASPVASPADAKKPEDKRESDVRVITRAVYRANGAGYLDYAHPGHIWVVAPPRNADEKVMPKQVTSGRFAEENINWSKDSSQIYFTSDRSDEPTTNCRRRPFTQSLPAERRRSHPFDMDAGGFAVSRTESSSRSSRPLPPGEVYRQPACG